MMPNSTPYSRSERLGLLLLAAIGFLVVNVSFLYGTMFEPGAMQEAMRNPISLAFMVEAMILMIAMAYLLVRWGVSRLHWIWFVVLSLVGSLAFSIPVALLWSERRNEPSK